MQTKDLMKGHVDYYLLGNQHLLVLCDENDKIMAYVTVRNNNEIGSMFVKPEYRGTRVVYYMKDLVLGLIASLGYTHAWFTFFPKHRKFYERWGAKVLPGIRPDGKLVAIHLTPRQGEENADAVNT